MSFVIYIAVLLAGLVSVMLGLQLATAPPPARTTQAPLVEPIRHPATSAKPVAPAVSAEPESSLRAAVKQAAPDAATAEQAAAAQTTAQSPDESAVPGCNISACETHYPKSFRAADCTYQPFEGPRRLCRK